MLVGSIVRGEWWAKSPTMAERLAGRPCANRCGASLLSRQSLDYRGQAPDGGSTLTFNLHAPGLILHYTPLTIDLKDALAIPSLILLK